MPPTVSVIVPVYDTEQYLRECLDSILQQTFSDLEVIVVDDASPDGSAIIVEGYCQADARVRCIRHQSNRGLPASRNSGLRAATGRYVYHVDSDDVLPSDALDTLVQAAEEDQVDVVMGHACFQWSAAVRSPAPPLARCKRLRRNIGYVDDPALWWGGGVVLCLFRRSFIVQNELYFDEDVSFGEDQIYLSKSLPRAERFTLVPHVVYYYRQREGSLSAPIEWPDSRWLEFGRWHRLSAHYRATYKPALNYFLRNGLKWRVAKLIAAKKALETSVFRQMLTEISEAYALLDFSDQWETMPPGYSMPAIPEQFKMLLCSLQSGNLAAADAELNYLIRNTGDEGMLGTRDKRLQKLWHDSRLQQR